MSRTLKVYNGRHYCCRSSDPIWDDVPQNSLARIYAAAYSRADLRRLITEYRGIDPGLTELRDYWSNAWGKRMEGVVPERGIWLVKNHESDPVRIA